MIISTNKQLEQAANTLKDIQQVAVDTEFYWMRTYYPELCLIQIATKNHVFLIDTLQDLDFSPLKNIFENKNIEKIIHSATNDVPIIKKFLNCEINNIFDTQLAATFLGFQAQLSLKNLLKEVLNIDMEKESQFSDWRKRPLSKKQLNYASKDVENLIHLREILEEKIEDKYRAAFSEELLNLQKCQFNTIEDIHTKIGNIKKFDKNIQRNAILIAQWREKIAQEKNIPVKFIFNNKILYIIAHLNPKSLKSFEHNELRKLSIWIKKGIISTLKSMSNIDNLLSQGSEDNKLPSELSDRAISYFDTQTKNINLDSTFIASRKDIRSLVYNINVGNNEIKNKLLHGWRYKIVGKKLKEYILENI